MFKPRVVGMDVDGGSKLALALVLVLALVLALALALTSWDSAPPHCMNACAAAAASEVGRV
jgi:hypothetical protein